MSIDARIILGVILGAPIIPATYNPPIIKAPIRAMLLHIVSNTPQTLFLHFLALSVDFS